MSDEYRKTRTTGCTSGTAGAVRRTTTIGVAAGASRPIEHDAGSTVSRAGARCSRIARPRSAGTGTRRRPRPAGRVDRRRGPTFEAVASEWWALVEAGTYARRRRAGQDARRSTKADYRLVLFGAPEKPRSASRQARLLIDRCGRRPLAALDDAYWQSFVDELARSGKSYSRISTYLAVIRHIYVYARRANRRLVPRIQREKSRCPPTTAGPESESRRRKRPHSSLTRYRLSSVASALSWDAVLEIRRSSSQRRRRSPDVSVSATPGRKGPSGRALQDARELPRTGVKRPSRVGARLLHRHASQRDRQGRNGLTSSGTPTRSWSPHQRARRGRVAGYRWSARSRRSCAKSGCARGNPRPARS